MGETIATFKDKQGNEREIHRTHCGLRVRKLNDTPALVLNQSIAGLMGARIRHYRKEQHLTLAQLCLAAGLSAANPKARMWEIENAKRREGLRLGTLYAIAAALHIEVSDLLPTVEEVMAEAPVETVLLERLVTKNGA